jgi:chorismate mutase
MQALQAGRWQAVIDSRKEFAKELGLSPEFIEKIWNEIHDYSLSLEEKII